MPCMRGVHIVGGEYYACRKATTAYLNCMRYIQSAGPGTTDQKMRKCATSRGHCRGFFTTVTVGVRIRFFVLQSRCQHREQSQLSVSVSCHIGNESLCV